MHRVERADAEGAAPASVGNELRFTFDLPTGFPGAQGDPGPPVEVTAADLANEINGTSPNTNNLSTLDSAFADPDMEALRQKINELILNGRR